MKLTKYDFESRLTFVRKVGGEFVYLCPLCRDKDHGGHLYYNPNSEAYYCFKCKLKGYTSTRERAKTLVTPEDISLESVSIPKGFVPIWNMEEREINTQPFLKKFLADKEIYPSISYQMQLYFSLWRQAILIPVLVNGIIVAAQIRNLIQVEGQPKYYPAKGTHPSRYLYNIDKASQYRTVVIVEGPFDTPKVGDNVIALFGTSITKYQFQWLSTLKFDNIILLLDSNATVEAFKLSIKLSEICSNVRIAPLKMGGNVGPSAMSKTEIMRTLFHAEEPKLNSVLHAQWQNASIKLASTL